MFHIFDVNKFGRNPDVDVGSTPEDIWDRGGIWLPPTSAQVHNIVSSNAADGPGITGMRTVRIEGLQTWSSQITFEVVTLNGLTPVPTIESYVIIHRMVGLTFGFLGSNAGDITATAIVDGVVTAQIATGVGQTKMAIFGIPSDHALNMSQYYFGMNRQNAAGSSADVELLVNSRPNFSDGGFVAKHHLGVGGDGSSHVGHPFSPNLRLVGPAIVKLRVENVSANNTDMSGGFDGELLQL